MRCKQDNKTGRFLAYNLDAAKIKNLYLNDIKSSIYIARLFNVSSQTIVNLLRKHGVTLRPSGGNISRREYSTREEFLFRKRIAENKRRVSIGKELKVKEVQMVYENNITKYGTLTCYLCLKPIMFGEDSIDHKTPVSRGGTNAIDNLGITHMRCNSSKNNKTYEEYLKSKEEKWLS